MYIKGKKREFRAFLGVLGLFYAYLGLFGGKRRGEELVFRPFLPLFVCYLGGNYDNNTKIVLDIG